MPRHWPRRVLLGTLVGLSLAACGTGESREDPSATTVEPVLDGTNSDDAASAASTPRPRRIILISLDTVGSRNVGGYSDAQTPTMEKIAADGVRFERFYAASTYTLPSHMSMLTGLDPIEHGVANLPARLAPEVPTLASQLRAAGYFTKAVVEGGFVSKVYGFDQGFSDFTEMDRPKGLVWNGIWGVLDWMRRQQDAPYFLFLHTYIAHNPYNGFNDFRNEHP
jgi:arylsulfatase A-like enzyme